MAISWKVDMTIEFRVWPKIPRIENEKTFFTEKIDGTNACVIITAEGEFACQSRKRLITPEDDNFGFARWAHEHKDELMTMGEGHHYGEWWGSKIGRCYDLEERRFSLFNTARWNPDNPNLPECCNVVPIIDAETIEEATEFLVTNGSQAAKGYMNVEGLVMFKYLTKSYYKIIINKPKGG